MCVIALTKPGTKLLQNEAEAMFTCNPDGAGFAYVNASESKVVINKGFNVFEQFWRHYSSEWDKHGKTSPFLVHFRIATKGRVGHLNCHPYMVEDGKSALAHNGTLWSGSVYDNLSDTAEFVDELKDYLKNEELIEKNKIKLGDAVRHNRMVLLYSTGNTIIFNENTGNWDTDKNIWYSNTYWKYRVNRQEQAPTSGVYNPVNNLVMD